MEISCILILPLSSLTFLRLGVQEQLAKEYWTSESMTQ